MGGIEIETPLSLAKCQNLKSIPSSLRIGQFGHVELKYFKEPSNSHCRNVFVRNLNELQPIKMNVSLSKEDFLWICGRKIIPVSLLVGMALLKN